MNSNVTEGNPEIWAMIAADSAPKLKFLYTSSNRSTSDDWLKQTQTGSHKVGTE